MQVFWDEKTPTKNSRGVNLNLCETLKPKNEIVTELFQSGILSCSWGL